MNNSVQIVLPPVHASADSRPRDSSIVAHAGEVTSEALALVSVQITLSIMRSKQLALVKRENARLRAKVFCPHVHASPA